MTEVAEPADQEKSPFFEKKESSLPNIVVIGNPNTGKSTLFNALTGLRQKVANYPGVTVEKHLGLLNLGAIEVQLVDVPGTYSLAAQSPDEMVAVDVLLGQTEKLAAPKAVLVVVDASNLRRNLYLLSQVLEISLPIVVALNMTDLAQSKGIRLDLKQLQEELGIPLVELVASKGEGLAALKNQLEQALTQSKPAPLQLLQELQKASTELSDLLQKQGVLLAPFEAERALVDEEGYAEKRLLSRAGQETSVILTKLRQQVGQGKHLATLEAQRRYAWINKIIHKVESSPIQPLSTWSDRFDRILNHPIIGSLLFVLLMGTVFQAVFFWAAPLMDVIDGATSSLNSILAQVLPEGALASLLMDGVVAGVGSVVIFLPQILILFAFIILLEDSGYMARAAFLMDRLMRWCGLSGQSFIPMLSSFACAVPGIMATRVIPNPQDRLATILAAPFMTCSARLPVYALLIAAFIPPQHYAGGLINLQGLVLLGLYLLGIFGGVLTALLLKRTLLRGPTPSFLMELPPFRRPNLRSVLYRLIERGRIFLVRAGTIIFTVAVIVWALAYFPRPEALHLQYEQARIEAAQHWQGAALEQHQKVLEHKEAAAYLDQSLLGRIGKGIEPLFRPLGWDWKVSAGVVASFPAREVVIAVLGTIYSVGADVEANDAGLVEQVRSATWPGGEKVYTLPMALGLMVFYAFCLQCMATVATIRREANSWKWAGFAWVYMTGLGYMGALLTFQIGSRM